MAAILSAEREATPKDIYRCEAVVRQCDGEVLIRVAVSRSKKLTRCRNTSPGFALSGAP